MPEASGSLYSKFHQARGGLSFLPNFCSVTDPGLRRDPETFILRSQPRTNSQ